MSRFPLHPQKKATVLLAALLVFSGLNVNAQAPRFGGYLWLDKRFVRQDNQVRIADFYNRLRLEMSVDSGDRLGLFASLEARFYDFSRAETLEQLSDLSAHDPTDLSIWEAYGEVREFLFHNVDLRIGKQRIAWGTADGLNPTDNLNPDDFSDLVDFTRKVPTWAVRADIYWGETTLTAVWQPTVHPVLLPGGISDLSQLPEEFQQGWKVWLERPSRSIKHSVLGLRLSGQRNGVDLSLSYFCGYDDVPVPRSARVTRDQAELRFVLPRMQVLGFDFATEISGTGLWGEFAIFFPEEIRFSFESNLGLDYSYETILLPDNPYLKFTLGGDHTFPGGWYVNGQWMHGFFVERGKEELHDYLILSLEKNLLSDRIRLKLGGAMERGAEADAGTVYGYGVFPELIYQEIDNLEIALGSFWAEGEPGTTFDAFLNVDQAYVRVKVTF